MKLKMNIIDAFTDKIFKGNSAAVIIIEQWLSVELMQSIATENNLSETAFVKSGNEHEYDIRWFSPITEIDFCGHATLAASFVIFSNYPEINSLSFYAKAVGKLKINRKTNGFIEMQFPNRMPKVIDDIPEALIKGLSIAPSSVLLNEQAYFVIYNSEADVLNVIQNKSYLKKLAPLDVVVTAKSSEHDFISRYFWPANGTDEDPVTGSIHAGLAPYWSAKLGKAKLNAYQASKRGGHLTCRVEDDAIYISGKAVHYLEGTITI
jgi:PhzF family phenazine biosynthesis protein